MTTSYLHNLEQKQSCITHGSLLAAVSRCSVEITQLKMSGNPGLSQLDLMNLMDLGKLIKKKLPMLSSKQKLKSICAPCKTKCPKCCQEFSQLEIMSHIINCASTLEMMHVQPTNAGIAEYNLTLNLYCNFCKFTINNFGGLQVHSSDEIHKKKINESIKIVDTSLIFCVLCQEFIPSKLNSYEKHITSRLHRIMNSKSPQDWMKDEIYYIGYKNKLRCLKCKHNFQLSRFSAHQHEIDTSKNTIFSVTKLMTLSLLDFRNQPRVKVYYPSYQCPVCSEASATCHHFPACFSVLTAYGGTSPQNYGSFSNSLTSFTTPYPTTYPPDPVDYHEYECMRQLQKYMTLTKDRSRAQMPKSDKSPRRSSEVKDSVDRLRRDEHHLWSKPIAPPTPKPGLTTNDRLGGHRVSSDASPRQSSTLRSSKVDRLRAEYYLQSKPVGLPAPKPVLTTSPRLREHRATSDAYPTRSYTISPGVTNSADHRRESQSFRQATNQPFTYLPSRPTATPTRNEDSCLIL